MERLISDEVLDKYLVKEIVVTKNIRGTTKEMVYHPIFEYDEDHPVDSNGELLAHRVIVGFRSESGEAETGELYLPVRLPNGLLSKNKTAWYDVKMVIPPISFRLNGYRRHLNQVVNPSTYASSLHDFFPDVSTSRFVTCGTPFVKEVDSELMEDVRDISKWIVVSVGPALIDLFNFKIKMDIERSGRGGFKGISSSVRALHTLINAFMRYTEDPDEDDRSSKSEFIEVEEEIECLGSISAEDKQNAVVMHPLIKDITILPGGPIDFCSCNQSFPIRTGRIRDGFSVVAGKFVKTSDSTFPYTSWRRAVVGVMSDDPRRVIVSRGISRAMRLEDPDVPYAITDTVLKVDSVSLPGVRMTHPLNHEDGILVSETFARKAGAYKVVVDKFTVPATVKNVWIVKGPQEGNMDVREQLKILYKDDRKKGRDKELARHIIRRGDLLASIQYKDTQGEIVTEEIRTKSKCTGIVIKSESFTPAEDIEEPRTTYRIVSMVYIPLGVGDKVADAHGNKATVSIVLPDSKMPVWRSNGDEINIHYIATPYVMKRLAMGAEVEDKLALCNYLRRRIKVDEEALSSDVVVSMEEADSWLSELGLTYTGTVELSGQEYKNIPVSLRSMFRLDNNASEVLTTRARVELDEYRRVTHNAKMGIDIVALLARGATVLVNQIIEKSGARHYVQKTLVPLLYALEREVPSGQKSFTISNRLPREVIGNPMSHELLSEFDLDGTVCDSRIANEYGIIDLGKLGKAVVPPHRAITNAGSGCVKVSNIAVAANRLFAERHSYMRGYHDSTDVSGKLEQYARALADSISGKGGILRQALLPVFPTTIRAVVSSRMPAEGEDQSTIAIPRKEFYRLKREHSGFASVYSERKRYFCLIKRDPVHRCQNFIAVPFVLWDNDSIGVPPLLIGTMDGDFDGDTVFAMFPTDHESFKDLLKLVPEHEDVVEPSKVVVDASPEDAYDELRKRIGIASTFANPHETDQLKNPDLYTKLVAGMSEKERFLECMKAARDFEVVKDGTARTGALGLSFLFTREPSKKHLMADAMHLYHLLAQNTLDAKAGVSQPALEVVEGARSGDEDAIKRNLVSLGFESPECTEEFLGYIRKQKAFRGRMNMLTNICPVLSVTQSGAGRAQAHEVARRIVREPTSGTGVWESMLDYLMGRVETSPYDWAEKKLVMSEKIQRLSELFAS